MGLPGVLAAGLGGRGAEADVLEVDRSIGALEVIGERRLAADGGGDRGQKSGQEKTGTAPPPKVFRSQVQPSWAAILPDVPLDSSLLRHSNQIEDGFWSPKLRLF